MTDQKRTVIVAKQLSKSISVESIKEKLMQQACRIAYHYPQYTPEEALRLNVKLQRRLLRTVEKIDARRMYMLTQIAAAPSTKKGSGVNNLINYFRKLM